MMFLNRCPDSLVPTPPVTLMDSLRLPDENLPLDATPNPFILIVDDNPTNLSVLATVLKQAGYKTRVAMDGESAIEQVLEDPPEIILMDIQMPGIDGIETCIRLKQDARSKDIPIIFITASADVENKVQGLSVGAVDYITKPFQHEEVLARVKVHLKIQSLTRTVQAQAIALQQANQELLSIANLDGLTAVANRRHFDAYLEHEWKRLAREQQPLSLILCDIDYFKNFNDHYGHQVGDECLKQVAQTLKATAKRSTDLVARYGGEEFAVILPNTSPAGAQHLAELMRDNVYQLQIQHQRSAVGEYLTLSLGISSLKPASGAQVKSLITMADKALYVAKHQGRNQAYLYTDGDKT
jgi:diguanylate cyclase (GGDEF)-like protein